VQQALVSLFNTIQWLATQMEWLQRYNILSSFLIGISICNDDRNLLINNSHCQAEKSLFLQCTKYCLYSSNLCGRMLLVVE
jgi:hypothetical protein